MLLSRSILALWLLHQTPALLAEAAIMLLDTAEPGVMLQVAPRHGRLRGGWGTARRNGRAARQPRTHRIRPRSGIRLHSWITGRHYLRMLPDPVW